MIESQTIEVLIDRVTELAEEVGKLKEQHAMLQDMLEDDDDEEGFIPLEELIDSMTLAELVSMGYTSGNIATFADAIRVKVEAGVL